MTKILSELGYSNNKVIKVQVKIDTGMGRLGFWHKEAFRFIKRIQSLGNIVIEGLFTHFPSAEEDKSFTGKQIRNFSYLIEDLLRHKIDIPIRHTSNSAAIVGFKDSHMNMVRPGLIMYGLYPNKDIAKKMKLKPALKLKTKVVYVKSVSEGRSISYGRTFITKVPTRIATIPVGYGDGYSRSLSNCADVLIKGRRYPVVGRVCMDMTMVDIGQIKNIKSGDEVVLIGKQGSDRITAEELAERINTIPYEVVCNIGHRVPRVYIR